MDTTIKKRPFQLTQTLMQRLTPPRFVTYDPRILYGSVAEVSFQGQRRICCFNVVQGRSGRFIFRLANRVIGQTSTRHLSGPELTTGSGIGGCELLLDSLELLSIPFDANRIDVECQETGFRQWCDDNLLDWFEVVVEGHPEGEKGFMLFEDERDAIHFKLRWC